MELRQLGCFVAVAEELHFGRAAARLHMLPSALGRHIRLLEEELGARLLLRTTRHVALTPAGQALLEEARIVLAAAQAAAARVRALGGGAALRLGAIDSAASTLVPPLLSAFRQRHPAVDIRLTEEKSSRLLPQLEAGRLDLVFIRTPPAGSGLAFRALGQEKLVAALPEGHPLALRKSLAVRDLVGERLILPPRHARPHSHALVRHLFESADLPPPRPAQEAAEKQTIIALVAAGMGVALVPEWVARLQAEGLAYRPLEAPPQAAPEAILGAAWMPSHASVARDIFLAMLEGLKRKNPA